MIDLIIKTPYEDTVVFSDTITITYEVRDDEGFFHTVKFDLNDQKYVFSTRSGSFSVTLPAGSYTLEGFVVNKNDKEIFKTKKLVNFSVQPVNLEVRNKLSSVVSSSIPDFLEQEYAIFVEFIKQYYAWLETSKNINLIPHSLEQVFDIDTVPQEFLYKFKETYLFGLPNKFAKDKETNTEIDLVKVIKKIKQFYSKKGTEDSFRFLFRVMFDTEITFSYPREKILYLSKGQWEENTIIKINGSYLKDPSILISKELYSLDENENKTFSALVDNIFTTTVMEKTVVTAVLKNVIGSPNSVVYYSDLIEGSIEQIQLELYSMIVGVEFTSCPDDMIIPLILGEHKQYDYLLGQKIYLELLPNNKELVCLPTCLADINQDLVVDGVDLGMLLSNWGAANPSIGADFNKDGVVNGEDLGTLLGNWGGCPLCVIEVLEDTSILKNIGNNFLGIISKVDEKGSITQVKIVDPGVNYTKDNITRYSIKIMKPDNSGKISYDCRMKFVTGYMFTESGKYINKKSLLSEISVLQDNFYYQQNSYEIGASANPAFYSEILKQNAHPAGYKPFYQYDILDKIPSKQIIDFTIEQY